VLARAGQRAYEREDMHGALNLLGRAVGLLPEGDEERPLRQIELADALRETGDFAGADALLARVAEGADGALEAHALLGRAHVRLFTNALDAKAAIEQAAANAADVCAAANDHLGVAKATYLLGLMRWNVLDNAAAESQFVRALAAADAAGSRRARVRAQLGLVLAWVNGPTPVDDALAQIGELLVANPSERGLQARLGLYSAALEGWRGNIDDARRVAAGGAALLEELGKTVLRASAAVYPARAELAAGDTSVAEAVAREALAHLDPSNGNAPVLAGTLAEALYRQGRLEEAEQALELAAQVEADDLLTRVPTQTTRAKVLAARGAAAEAVGLARATLAEVCESDALLVRADALAALGEALEAAGAAGDAAFAEANSLYEAKGATALVSSPARRRAPAPAPSAGTPRPSPG
jgi:tetratricopeptide (TPR) repeat protein